MKKYSSSLIVMFLLMVSSANIFAQGDSAVPFLLINPGARPGGMGEAGVAYSEDATAIYWIPGEKYQSCTSNGCHNLILMIFGMIILPPGIMLMI